MDSWKSITEEGCLPLLWRWRPAPLGLTGKVLREHVAGWVSLEVQVEAALFSSWAPEEQ